MFGGVKEILEVSKEIPLFGSYRWALIHRTQLLSEWGFFMYPIISFAPQVIFNFQNCPLTILICCKLLKN